MTERHASPDQRSPSRAYDTDARAPLSPRTTRDARPSAAGAAAREQRARARLLDRVRERARKLANVAR
jgi:hypothetical protein